MIDKFLFEKKILDGHVRVGKRKKGGFFTNFIHRQKEELDFQQRVLKHW